MATLDRIASAVERLFVSRRDAYAVQLPEGGYIRVDSPLTREVILRHLSGELTVGSYTTAPGDLVKNIVFDIDPEHVPSPGSVAQALAEEASRRLSPEGVILEASRWPDPSYHVWVCFEPMIPAAVARWIGRRIVKFSGAPPDVEVFPKQDSIGSGWGNLVKLPLGLHRREGKWSTLLNRGLNPAPPDALLCIRPLSVPRDEVDRVLREVARRPIPRGATGGTAGREIRPCIKRALRLPLTGSRGHLMRLAVVAEYASKGAGEDAIVRLFSHQENYDEGKTRYYVRHALSRGYSPFTCTSIEELGYCLGGECPLLKTFLRHQTMDVEVGGERIPMRITSFRSTSSTVLHLTGG
jgi:hypothetical protein